MLKNSHLPSQSRNLSKEAVALIGFAALLSLASIWIAYDFGSFFDHRVYLRNSPQVVAQTFSVALGGLLAWMAWKAQPGRPCPRLALFWIGIILLVFPWWDRSFQGTRSYICPNGNWYFRVDALGILLILPQWIRWAANETRESITGLREIVRRWISPSALFTLTLVAGNLNFLSQSNHFASLLWNVIGLLLWYFGPLKRSWKITAGVFFAMRLLLLCTALFSDSLRYYRIASGYGHHPTLLQNLVFIPEAGSDFHHKIQKNPLWYPGFAQVPYPKPRWRVLMRQFQFSEQVADIVRFRTGLLGTLCLGMILAGMGVAMVRIARQPGTAEQRLWRIALAAFLFTPMVGSMIATLSNTWLLPQMSFPFLGSGLILTTTAWLALGLLLRKAHALTPTIASVG